MSRWESWTKLYYLEPNSHCKSKEAFWAEQDPVREIHPHLQEDKEHYLEYIMVYLGNAGSTPSHSIL